MEIKCGKNLAGKVVSIILEEDFNITSLGLKDELRSLGFYVSQKESSNFLKEISKEKGLKSVIAYNDDNIPYLNYSEG